MIPTSDLCLWSPQNHSLRVLKSAVSTRGPEGEVKTMCPHGAPVVLSPKVFLSRAHL